MSSARRAIDQDGATAIFIAGTDTSVGKTLICSLLLGFFLDKGYRANCQKWISTGGENPDDLLYCHRQNDLRSGSTVLKILAPYRFKLAASPHLAAEVEERSVEPEVINSNLTLARADNDLLLVEGVGGLQVPLKRDLLLVDLVADLGLPVILVARSGLGTLNHTLMSVESLKSRGIALLGIIFSDEQDYEPDDLLVNDNMKIIGDLAGAAILGRLPRCRDYQEAVAAFRPIGEQLAKIVTVRRKPHD